MSRDELCRDERWVGILQPGYFPWLGFFHQMSMVDLFILQDDAQYTRNSWRQRMKVRTREGWRWLTVPVRTKGRHPQRITDVRIDNTKVWRQKHMNVLDSAFSRSPFWPEHRERVMQTLEDSGDSLVDLDVSSIRQLAEEFGIDTPVERSSLLGLEDRFASDGRGKRARSTKLANFVRSLGGTHFLEGATGRNLLDLEVFQEVGVELVFHEFQHPVYNQCWPGFEPYMSSIDLLLNCRPGDRQLSLGLLEAQA